MQVREQRVEFVVRALRGSEPLSRLCVEFGISRPTGYCWLGRYREGGIAAIEERSRRPHESPARTGAELETQVVALRKKYPDWGARKLAVLLGRQGIALLFSGIRHPQTQGKVERFHGSMERALDCRGVPAADHRLWLDEFRREHNQIRPHEALQMQTPTSRWQPSPRSYNPNPPAWQYPQDAWTLKIDNHGTIDIREQPYRISKALIGERVRILPVEQRFLVYYCNTLIGEIDPETRRSAIIDQYVAAPPPCP
jgi:hypothetical protein